MNEHELKIGPRQFDDILHNGKGCEVRFNDRNYKVGDLVILHEHIVDHSEYTGRYAWFIISHIQESFGLKQGWVVLSWETIAWDDLKDLMDPASQGYAP